MVLFTALEIRLKVVYLVPGSGGGFYCENCMRDIPLINSLKQQDVDVTMIPIYLPLFTDEENYVSYHGVFLGAINLYLKYKFPIMKKMPGWMTRFFNSLPMLKLAAKMSNSTEATSLENLTMDMLTGDMPYIEKEINELVDFLIEHIKPDIIHISNTLLIGLGINIKKRLWKNKIKCKLVCTLQDEHTWLDVMKEPYRTTGWEILKNSVGEVDLFFPVSSYYKNFMDEILEIPAGKSKIVFNGIEHQKYSSVVPSSNPPVIGYLSRIHKGFGLEKLTDIYIDLKNEPGFENIQLRITGGSSSVDRKFIKQIKRKLKSYIKSGDVQFYKQFDIKHRLKFFTGMTLLSVPMEQPEAFGIYLLEAMASGVPVVQPDIGAFSEIVDFESGCVYDSEIKKSLYNAIKKIIIKPDGVESRAIKARQHTISNFSLDIVASKLKEYYEELIYSGIEIKEK